MKLSSFGLVVTVAAAVSVLSACGCFQQRMRGEAAPPPTPEQRTAVAPEQKETIVVGKGEQGAAGAAALAAGLADIHFDFDRYNIRPGDAETLKKDYGWIRSDAKGRVRIEGNCDERGTVEYNLALGQKRADAAKAFLVGLGIDARRLDTVSYGKEKPVDPGHNERAWAKNRRDHFTPIGE